jgi:hypothetical protein
MVARRRRLRAVWVELEAAQARARNPREKRRRTPEAGSEDGRKAIQPSQRYGKR